MATIYLAVDSDGTECIFDHCPLRKTTYDSKRKSYWESQKQMQGWVEVPEGTIEKIIGKKLTWQDQPVKMYDYEEKN